MKKLILFTSYLIHQTSALRLLLTSSLLLLTSNIFSQEKEIYIPKDLRTNNFESDTARWSNQRMALTPNFVVFWERGFGNDLSRAPQLEGTDMTVDLQNLTTKLEQFYAFYKDSLRFILPGSKADRYRMMAMLNYSLEGTAYGGDYDETIGALWIAPNRVKDRNLNAIAHEIGHSFQSQIISDGQGECWGGGGIFEMCSQWMLWQVNPHWIDDEYFHWQAFIKQANLPFLALENIYHSPYVLEHWSYLHGRTVIADLFRAGKRGEDPAQTYMRMFNLDERQFALELCDAYSRLLTFDYPRVHQVCSRYSNQLLNDSPLMTYGVNIRPMTVKGKKATLTIHSESPSDGYAYRIVAVDDDNRATYSDIITKGKTTLRIPKNTKHIYSVVVAYPADGYKPEPFRHHKQEDTPRRIYSYTIE